MQVRKLSNMASSEQEKENNNLHDDSAFQRSTTFFQAAQDLQLDS